MSGFVTIAMDALRAAAPVGRGRVWVLLTLPTVTFRGWNALRTACRLAEREFRSTSDDPEPFHLTRCAITTVGPAAELWLDQPDRFEEVLLRIATLLEEKNWSGELVPPDPVRLTPRRDTPELTALCLLADDASQDRVSEVLGRWWQQPAPGDGYFESLPLSVPLPVHDQYAGRYLQESLSRGLHPILARDDQGIVSRRIEFAGTARLLVSQRIEGRWQDDASSLAALIAELSHDLAWAAVTRPREDQDRTWPELTGLRQAALPLRAGAPTWLDRQDAHEAGQSEVVPAVHGIQLLGSGHRRRLTTPGGWQVRELPGGRALVTAGDLDAWLGDHGPDATAVHQAQNAWAALLVTAGPRPQPPPPPPRRTAAVPPLHRPADEPATDGVQVDEDALRTRWQEDVDAEGDGEVVLVLRTNGDPARARTALRAAATVGREAIEAETSPDQDVLGLSEDDEIVITGLGPAIAVGACDDVLALLAWARAVAGHLGHEGVSGTLTALTPEYPPGADPYQQERYTSAFLEFEQHPQAGIGGRALAWCQRDGAAYWLRHDHVSSRVHPDDVNHLWHTALAEGVQAWLIAHGPGEQLHVAGILAARHPYTLVLQCDSGDDEQDRAEIQQAIDEFGDAQGSRPEAPPPT